MQATVFKYLLQQWQDYQNFAGGFNDAEVGVALDKLSSRMHQLHSSSDDKEAHENLTEERKKLAMPRFETLQEREDRLRREKERAEFGDVSVAFRLSTPNPGYTYYTDLPEGFRNDVEEEDKEESAVELLTRPDRQAVGAKSSVSPVCGRTPLDMKVAGIQVHARSKSDTAELNSNGKGNPLVRVNHAEVGVSTRARHTSTPCQLNSHQGPVGKEQPSPSIQTSNHNLAEQPAFIATKDYSKQRRPDTGRNQLSPSMTRSYRRLGNNRSSKSQPAPSPSRKRFTPYMETIHMQLSGDEGRQYTHAAGLVSAESRRVIACSTLS